MAAASLRSSATEKQMQHGAFENIPLPHGIRSRFVPNVNGLTMHLLKAGFESKERPCVVLLHGFPLCHRGHRQR
jgi:hypothetical protein